METNKSVDLNIKMKTEKDLVLKSPDVLEKERKVWLDEMHLGMENGARL